MGFLRKVGKKIKKGVKKLFSSKFGKILGGIGLSMILKDYWDIGQNIIVQTLDGQKRNGTITSLPFPD